MRQDKTVTGLGDSKGLILSVGPPTDSAPFEITPLRILLPLLSDTSLEDQGVSSTFRIIPVFTTRLIPGVI